MGRSWRRWCSVDNAIVELNSPRESAIHGWRRRRWLIVARRCEEAPIAASVITEVYDTSSQGDGSRSSLTSGPPDIGFDHPLRTVDVKISEKASSKTSPRLRDLGVKCASQQRGVYPAVPAMKRLFLRGRKNTSPRSTYLCRMSPLGLDVINVSLVGHPGDEPLVCHRGGHAATFAAKISRRRLELVGGATGEMALGRQAGDQVAALV